MATVKLTIDVPDTLVERWKAFNKEEAYFLSKEVLTEQEMDQMDIDPSLPENDWAADGDRMHAHQAEYTNIATDFFLFVEEALEKELDDGTNI